MSKARRMCHKDVGAPAYYGYKRDAIYSFMDTIFLTGYNIKFIDNYVRNGRTVTLNYASAHGYVQGQLLQIEGATFTSFNTVYHRVTSVPNTTSLTIYLKDDAYDSYPVTATEVTFKTLVAPLNWEKVYESSTQRSYRSRSTDSSKIVFTIKKPVYNNSKFVTEGAIAYEIDLSKDIDTQTGTTIDSCFVNDKSAYGHSCRYWVVSSNNDDLFNSMSYNTTSETPAPWTLIGDESMVYFISSPFEPYNDYSNPNSYYRQIDTYTGQTRFPKIYAFGDISPKDTQEYLTGSSFYFKFYYARAGSWEGSLTNSEYNPFTRSGNWSWWDAFFSAFDPTGTPASARIQTVGSSADNGYTFNGGYYLWNAYPQRVSGGITYFDFLAYSDGPSGGRNSVNCFYKGVFKYIKFADTNLQNIGDKGFLHNRVHATDLPYKFVYTVNNSANAWNEPGYQGYYVLELD